jgi:acetyl-CoA synthetase
VTAAAGELLEQGRRLDRRIGEGIGLHGLLVEPMLPAGLELIVGLKRDPQFGPLVLVGLGGVLAELLDDVAVELAPIDPATAGAMLDRLRGARLLAGWRGRPDADRAALVEFLVAVARLGWARPALLEIDLNPVIAGTHGIMAADALVVVAEHPG